MAQINFDLDSQTSNFGSKTWFYKSKEYLEQCLDTSDLSMININNIVELYVKSLGRYKEKGYIICNVFYLEEKIGDARFSSNYYFLPFSYLNSIFPKSCNDLIVNTYTHMSVTLDKIPLLVIHHSHIEDKEGTILEQLADYNQKLRKYVPIEPSVSLYTVKLTDEQKSLCNELLEKPKKRTVTQKEKELETDLYCWLSLQGVAVERQVSTKANHRLDLWIPGKLMLELKIGTVNGNDLCQAIDYSATYTKSVVLVGKGITTQASRGLDGFNKVNKANPIVFITWSGVKDYLSSCLDLSNTVTKCGNRE